jgi:NADPH:quinone reductase-like Zn-dependent oxidoreductase
VRLRVKAIGLNCAEVMFRMGRYLVAPELPSKIGYEASGIVETVGEGVDRSWLGKIASSVPAFALNKYGVYGKVAIVPAYAPASFPDRLSFEKGTSVWMQYLTAYGALVMQEHVARGTSFRYATRTSKKKADLLALGANHVIAKEEEDLVARVNEITSGRGARIVFDPVAGKGLEVLASATAENGIIFEYGALASEPTIYPLFAALRKHLTIKGYTLFEVVCNPAVFAKVKQYVFDQIAAGDFRPRIDKIFPLSQIVEPHRYMASNAQIGKIVATV